MTCTVRRCSSRSASRVLRRPAVCWRPRRSTASSAPRDELIDQGACVLKGIDAEWRLYLVSPLELDDAVVGDHELTTFISRAAERAHLCALVRAAAAGTGGMVLISGQADIGKQPACSGKVSG